MVNVGFIGAGGRSSSHLETLQGVDAADVIAVCDIDESVAEAGADPHGAAVFTDHETMYAEHGDDLDAVFVGLPPFAHEDQELMAAERGIDLFVEKPLALTNEKAIEINDAIQENGVVAQVGYQRRYADAVHEAADILEGRPVGMVEGWWKGGVPGTAWWRVKARSGGQVVEQATHHYDMIRFFGGDVEEVTAYGGNRIVDEIDFEDVVTASMRHETGATSHVASSSAVPDSGAHGTEVIAEGAHLTLQGNAFEGVVDGERVEYEGDANPSEVQVEAFVEASEQGDPSMVKAPYSDAVKSFSLTLAVNESLETGAPVEPEV